MDPRLTAGRALMGDSLGFHLIFIIFGIGLPLLICGMELYGILRKNARARALARTWSKALVILFIAGAMSGTVISLQFDLLWPTFMSFVSKTVGIAFAVEGIAFMVEALFLSIYMLSWDRFKPWIHWVCSLPIVAGSLLSAVFITMVNGFMNQPAGFSLASDGKTPTDIHVAQALLSPTSFAEIYHSVPAYILAATLVVLAVYAWMYLKKNHAGDRVWLRKLLIGLSGVALFFGLIVAISGDHAGKNIAEHQPAKLAAAEALYKTQANAPLILGGIVEGDQIKYGLQIPSLLSFLATNNFSAVVQGLDKVPPQDRPPIWVHYFFDGMAVIGILLIIVPAVFLLLARWRPRLAYGKTFLVTLIAFGPLAVVATEFGWMLTELGRQPFVIQHYLRTADALTTSAGVIRLAFIFPLFFVVLLILTVVVLRKTLPSAKIKTP